MKKYKLLFTKIAPIALVAAAVAVVASRDKNGRCHLDLNKGGIKPSSNHHGQGSYENPYGVFISFVRSHTFECLLGDTDAEAMARTDSTFITKQATTKLLRSSKGAGSHIMAFLFSTMCVLGSCGVPRVVHKKRPSFSIAVIFYVLASSAKVSFAGEATSPSPDQSALVQIQDISEHMNLRGSGERYLDLSDDERVKILSSFATDAIDLFSKIELLPDEDFGSGPDALRASSSLLSHLRDRVSDPLLMASLPHHAQSLFKSLTSEVSRAQAHVSKIESIATSHYVKDKAKTGTSSGLATHRQLTSGRKLSASPNSRVSWSDYHSRVRGRHLKTHELFGNQQGYHRARHSRNEGTHRRLSQDDEESYCIDVDPNVRKTDQCLRLASCAKNYNIYDLFVFLFGDDIDFSTGTVDDKERIEAYDDASLIAKLNTIRDLSDDIDSKYLEDGTLTDTSILEEDDLCDQLLQEFHRFDEDLSVKGKWQGGSVTGVCRGWGTNKFMSLEAIYHISDAVMSIRERVEHCLEELVDKFNTELENFTISTIPCNDELKNPDQSDIEFFFITKAQVQADIQKKFNCLKYSYLVKFGNTTEDGDCVDYECDPDSCKNMRFRPVFVAKDSSGYGFADFIWYDTDDVPNPYFDYEIPAVLPPRDTRRSSHWFYGFNFNLGGLGNFLVDYAPYRELTAEKFVLEVFNEYMGCANDIVKNLTGQLFDQPNGIYNPYSPGPATQFQLPMEIKEATKDTHGHIEDTYLNDVFKYKPVGDTGGIDTTADPPELRDGLKDFLAEVYAIDQSTDESIKYYEDDCDGDHCDELAEYYRDKRDKFFNKGFDRSSLDTSIALFFGNRTTIGQVCSYARGLKTSFFCAR